jgi:hypothetical protein
MEAAFVAFGYTASYNPIVTAHGEVLHAHRHDGELALATCCSPTSAPRHPRAGQVT